MANSRMEFSSYVNVRAIIENLSYGASSYNNFVFKVYKYVSGSWVSAGSYYAYGYEFGGQNWADHYFNGLEPGYYYYVETFANYGGSWYPSDPSVGTGYQTAFAQSSPIPDATFSNVTIQKTNITFDYTNTVGSMSLFTWNGSGWVGIASSGFSYSITNISGGHRITISGLCPNTAFYFYVNTYVGSYYSSAPGGSYNTYTTQAFPSVPSAPTVNYRLEGGYNLSWGNHGYEGYGIGYFLRKNGVDNYWFAGHSGDFGMAQYGVSASFDVAAAYYGAYPGGVGYAVGSYTSANSYYTAPSTPGPITFVSIGTTSITLTATGMQGTYYGVEWRVYQGTTFISSLTTSNMTSTITGLTAGVTYSFRCYGYGGVSTGLYSVSYAEITRTTDGGTPTLAQPSFSSYSQTSQSISYTLASITNATAYDLTIYDDMDNYVSSNYHSYAASSSFSSLNYNSMYKIVITVSANGYNSNSRTYYITTSDIVVPAPPDNVSFTQSGQTQSVIASWDKGAGSNYTDIDMSLDGSNWGAIDWSMQSGTYYSLDTGSFVTKYFRLRCIYYDGHNTVYGGWDGPYQVIFTQNTGNVYVHNGSSWVLAEVYTYQGGSWVKVNSVKTFNGVAWV